MSTLDEVRAADKRMQEAQRKLRAYAERPSSQPIDLEQHRNLALAVSVATDDYLKLVLALVSK